MSWSNVKLIFLREARDQLRDRRTLFMIAILPLLLYPLMGMIGLQILQFRREHPTRIWLVGADHLPAEPKLVDGDKFETSLCPEAEARLIQLTIDRQIPPHMRDPARRAAEAQDAIKSDTYDAVVYIPPQFAADLKKFREQVLDSANPDATQVPKPEIYSNTANDKSQVALDRVERILLRWRTKVVAKNLEARNVPVQATTPFEVVSTDVAEATSKRVFLWSRILPFVVLVWALTGAFYPAIDLCAGEKERGTLETLLSSPAQRSEIVWGKLLTVMSFSIVTSLLNLVSLAGTGGFVMAHFRELGNGPDLGPPPLLPLLWLIVALVPLSAMFSALSLAVAAFAKSSKEGQYYLMPLLMFTLPLMLFPLMPGTELEMGTAIIPVTGVIFLLRELMEGQYIDALRYCVPVIGVTALCCWLAIRWAVDQFNNESVLFRESERWDLRLWLRHLIRDRGETPTASAALLCGVLILVIRFFAQFLAPPPEDFRSFALVTIITIAGLVALPAVLMSFILTSNPRQTLSLYWPKWQMLPAAVLLAIFFHPVVLWLHAGIGELYPMNGDVGKQLEGMNELFVGVPLWQVFLLMAVMPAICEELAFRGFIMSGLRHTGHRWVAIGGAAVFFGIAHPLLQQSIAAVIMGFVIGYIVLRTGSLLPGVLFHLTHNGLAIGVPYYLKEGSPPWLKEVVQFNDDGLLYHPALAVVSGALAVGVLLWLQRQPYAPIAEERLQQALDHQTPLATKPQWR